MDLKRQHIMKWLMRHGIVMREMTTEEADRVAKLYHAAMAVDLAEAYAEDARRTFDKLTKS